MNPNYFEAIMIICFGVAWPVSIWKLLKTKKSHDKSIPFVAIVLVGYFSGICFHWFGTKSIIIWLYAFNALMVALDLALTMKYKKN